MAECDVAALMQDAKCFDCLTQHQMEMLQTQLLCEILQSGGGGGASCLLCGTEDPEDAPLCDCAIYFKRTPDGNGEFWYWDSDMAQWIKFIGGAS